MQELLERLSCFPSENALKTINGSLTGCKRIPELMSNIQSAQQKKQKNILTLGRDFHYLISTSKALFVQQVTNYASELQCIRLLMHGSFF